MNTFNHQSYIKPQHAIGEHGKPFIDKISIVLPWPNDVYPDSIKNGGHTDYNTEFEQAAYDAINDKSCFQQAQWKGYKLSHRILLKSSTAVAILQVFPKGVAKNGHVARVEFNPAKIGPDGLKELAFNLSKMFFGELDYVWNYGRVSSLDVAIDLHGATVGQLRFMQSWGTTQQLIKLNGMVQTIYLGKGKTQQTKIYDKSAQIGLNLGYPITRIERRVRVGVGLKDIASLKFPFGHLLMAHALPKAPENIEKWLWELFSDSIEKRGPSAAMALLPKDLRKVSLEAFGASVDPTWQPKEFWSHWPEEVLKLKAAFGLTQ